MWWALLPVRASLVCAGMKKMFLFLLLLSLGGAQAETIFLPGVSQESGWTDYNKVNPDVEDGDNNLCWAASASNMINYWQSRYVIPAGVPTGEEIWTTFKNSVKADSGGQLCRGYAVVAHRLLHSDKGGCRIPEICRL